MSESTPTVGDLGFVNADPIHDAQHLITVLRDVPDAKVRVRKGINLQEHDELYRREVSIIPIMLDYQRDKRIMAVSAITPDNKVNANGCTWQPSMLEAVMVEEIVTVL